MCAFHEEPSLPPFKAKSFTYQMCLVVRFVGAKKKSLIVVLSSVSLKEFSNLIWKTQSTERPQVCIDLSRYDNLWNIGREREETAGGKQKFSVKLIQGAFELSSKLFNIDVESYLALSVTNLKASFVHHYSPKHTISQKFSFFHNLWQKKAKC